MESKYSIKDLEHLTGIKAHTIRAWESRYGIIEPQRTPTNIRYYIDEDLKRILNVAVLVKGGMRISNVAKMSPEEIRSAVIDAGRYQGNYESQINALKISMLEYDEYLFDSIFNKCLIQFGTDETLTKILAPFIYEIGTLWQTGAITVTNEHFISSLVKQKMFSIIDQTILPPPDVNTKSYVLYLPAGELHELGLLYLYYHLKKRGHRVIYLGQSVPLEYLKEVTQKTDIQNFISIFTSTPHYEELDLYFERLSDMFNPDNYRFFLTGYQCLEAETKNVPNNVKILENLEELAKSLA
jgi:DNA-binding transcriptional MerR regulator